ncbi:hypothetical protein ONZ45_g17973 [Pleurotus djamor]|nr:hypothetical protein ONZ45_g17973 [Pleurotus djamor]
MIRPLPRDQSFLLATILEGLAYGFLLCLYAVNLFFGLGGQKRRDRHLSIMIVISSVMFFAATVHFAINSFRIIQGFSVHAAAPGGAVAYFDDFSSWDHVAKDALYGLQEFLGNTAATYRCFILWNRSWRIIALPLILTAVSTVVGVSICASFANPKNPNQSKESPMTDPLIQVILTAAVIMNVITTGLIAYRIWKTSVETLKYQLESKVLGILRIIVESAAVQLLFEILLLVLFSVRVNEAYIVLEMVTPVVAIAFSAITLRIRIRSQSSNTCSEYQVPQQDPVLTIGSTPSRRAKVEIVTQVEDDSDTYEPEGR